MIWEDLNKKLMILHADAKTTDDVFEQLGTKFIQEGFCKNNYVEELKKREKEYPTGLAINGFGIAIPHTEAVNVLNEAEGIMTLNEPVHFVQMGTTDTIIDVKVVMMLAIENPKEHIKKLQRIIAIIQDMNVLNEIYQANTEDEIIQAIKEKERKIEEAI